MLFKESFADLKRISLMSSFDLLPFLFSKDSIKLFKKSFPFSLDGFFSSIIFLSLSSSTSIEIVPLFLNTFPCLIASLIFCLKALLDKPVFFYKIYIPHILHYLNKISMTFKKFYYAF